VIRLQCVNKIRTGLLALYQRDASFLNLILWTDEATFIPNGIFNSRNNLLWHDEDPCSIQQTVFQYRWSINVWNHCEPNGKIFMNYE